MVTIEQLKEILQHEYDDDATNQVVYLKLLAVMQKHEGKPLSKRILTDFTKANPEYTTYWNDDYGMYHLDIWDGDSRHTRDNKMHFLIGYKQGSYAPDVDLTRFPEHNAWAYRGAIERNILRVELIGNNAKLSAIAKALNDYADAKERIENLTDYPTPDRYYFQKLVSYKS
jgi:hypothetical protein